MGIPSTPRSTLGLEQIAQYAFDETNGSLRTTPGAPTATIQEITLTHLNDSTKIGDGTNLVAVPNAAPSSDTGQNGLAVRVISQLPVTDNYRNQLLRAIDLVQTYTYSDFGLTTERISTIVYSASSVAGHTATKTFAYTLVGSLYRLDTVTWSNT